MGVTQGCHLFLKQNKPKYMSEKEAKKDYFDTFVDQKRTKLSNLRD